MPIVVIGIASILVVVFVLVALISNFINSSCSANNSGSNSSRNCTYSGRANSRGCTNSGSSYQ